MSGYDGRQSTTFESAGSYRTNMTALGLRSGTLRADGARLSFVANDGEVFFDGPIGSFHSVGLAEMNETLEVWEGATRHRISLVAGGPFIGNMQGEFESDTVAKRWRDYLAPLVGPVPAGVTVKKPMSKATQLTLILLFSVVIVIVVIAAVFTMG